jgi:hypothetical protein
LEILYIKQRYSQIRETINTKYKVLLNTIKSINIPLYNSFRSIFETYMNCIDLEESRQLSIEEHCTTNSVSLKQHEKYHLISNDLKDAILNLFSKFKTFLNELTIFFSKTYLTKFNGLRFKSFHSFYKSIIKMDTKNKLLKDILSFGAVIEDALIYRDKYIEHPKELYTFNLKTTPFEGSILMATKMENNPKQNLSINEQKELYKFNKDDKLFVLTYSSNITGNGLVYNYHLRPSSIFPKPSPLIKQLNIPILQGEALFQSFDETSIHFHEYGVHGHSFSDL